MVMIRQNLIKFRKNLKTIKTNNIRNLEEENVRSGEAKYDQRLSEEVSIQAL